MRPTTKPRQKWNTPPIMTPVINPASPLAPRPATAGIITGTNAKLVPWTIGSRAPTGPMPMVWNRVAMPANSIDIWIM